MASFAYRLRNKDAPGATSAGEEDKLPRPQVFLSPWFSAASSRSRKGHINRSEGQIDGRIAALDSFPRWQDLTVATLAKLSGYRCLISPAQASGQKLTALGHVPSFPFSLSYLLLQSLTVDVFTSRFSVLLALFPFSDNR